MDVVQTSLSLFIPPPIDNSIQREYWVEFNPIAAISGGGVIEFNIPVLHILDTILVHCILHILGTILVHCLI